ncbi:MAG: hypothetical protein H0W12_11345 [Chitinophagaceae bacterium]|nr:hypothetical protein [Chitinophagaceae bacterium]
MRKRTPLRAMLLAAFIIAISFYNFSRLTGSECIRTIHIVTLVTAGAGIGILLVNFFIWLRIKQPDDKP